MALDVILVVLFLLVGVAAQALETSDRLRDAVWLGYFWTITPLLVFATFLTFRLDRDLLLAVAAAIVATWLVALAGYGYAVLVATERDERGALTLAVGWPNTGFVGYPLAQLAFGDAGLSLAVVYDRLSWLLPSSSISTVVARLHGRNEVDVSRDRPLSAVLANPPLLAMAGALALRAGGVSVPFVSEGRSLAAAIVGPAGFFLLGLSLPLERIEHGRSELGLAAGALALRFAGGPLVLLAVGRLIGADVPGAFYLLAGMPCAFHLLVLARVYDMRPALMRLLVVGSTLPAVAAVVLGVGIAR